MSETVRVYHGSKRGLEGAIRADRGNPAADFGAGFYMGTDAHQPQTLICGGASPVLYTLDLGTTGLKVYEFQPGLDWVLFVAFCRGLVPAGFLETPFARRYREIRDGNDLIRVQFRREGAYCDEILDRMAKEGTECP